jgi:glutamate racemase
MPEAAPISKPIGVFDSGFGGLNTLRHLVAKLPAYDYLYLADSARAPYGPRTPDEIYAFSKQALDFLFARGAEIVIFACNTASSDALHLIQTQFLPVAYPGKKVLGVLIPLSEVAVGTTRNKKVGVLATTGTVRSGAFLREIGKLDLSVEIFQQAAPLLVPLIEAGEYQSANIDNTLEVYLRPLIGNGVDTIVLGCTHYDFLKGKIERITGPDIRIVSEGAIVAEKFADYLRRHPEIEGELARAGKRDFYTTGGVERFDTLGSAFFGAVIASSRASLTKM